MSTETTVEPTIEVHGLHPDLVQLRMPDRTYIIPARRALEMAMALIAIIHELDLEVRLERKP